MDPLPYNPRTFREAVEADLRRAARILIQVQAKLDPQFRIATPEGDYWLAAPFPNDKRRRTAMLDRIRRFLAWKHAFAFTVASELVAPDALRCVGIAFREHHACLSFFAREPRPWNRDSFGPVEWLSAQSIGPVIPSLLPHGSLALTNEEIAELQAWFGVRGLYPARHVGTGRSGR
jgi:hypothetical protein